MEIKGFQKLTLLDYPDKMAATIFLGGCNFRCGFCHNKELVINPNQSPTIPSNEVLEVLEKRKNLLDGVCITGGEPLLSSGLKEFIIRLKEMGYLVKLDTNGYLPDKLKELLDLNIIDYVAMDIKNSLDKYAKTVGLNKFNENKIIESIKVLKDSKVNYEFRTTIVDELHNLEDIEKIGILLNGEKKIYLQTFKDSPGVIDRIYSEPSKAKMNSFKKILSKYIKEVIIR